MKSILLAAASLLLIQFIFPPLGAEPTEMREWQAKGGFKIEAKALQVTDGKVQLERADGSKVAVPIDKFIDDDQAALRDHFELDDSPDTELEAPAEGEAASDLPYPLGKTTEAISCGDYNYFLYLPNSLRQGAKHPVIFVMHPGGGDPGTTKRYQEGAERNRWIIAVSKESKNSFEGSQPAIDAMIEEVTSSLPIDEDRMYTSGMSGGSRMALSTASLHKEIAGVIPCGAGGNLGSSKQVAYGLCGSNCFNRTDMANSFKGYRSKDAILRFFPGKHVWANAELIDDAITHLNGVFLTKNQRKYPDQVNDYVYEVSQLVEDTQENAPMRAYMWTSFLDDHNVLPDRLAATHQALGNDASNVLYLKGLTGVREFTEKKLGGTSASEWKISPKISAAYTKEAQKYAGTPWEEVLELMSEDAQKF